MSVNLQNEYGVIKIKTDIVAYIAGVATNECEKVTGLVAKVGKDGFVQLLKPDKLSKGVKINFEDDILNIDVHIAVEYGAKITEVADFIIGRVKYRVEEYTGLIVNNVNVFVEGIQMPEQ